MGDGDHRRGRGSFVPLQPREPLLRSSAVVCEPIELSFGVVRGVGPGTDVWNGVHVR